MRGMIAAVVAVLRSAGMKNSQIEPWLGEEIKRLSLAITVDTVIRWFFDCNSKKAPVPGVMLEAFHFFRPKPPQSPTEAEAKKRAAEMLTTAAVMKAGPLTQTPRRRG